MTIAGLREHMICSAAADCMNVCLYVNVDKSNEAVDSAANVNVVAAATAHYWSEPNNHKKYQHHMINFSV